MIKSLRIVVAAGVLAFAASAATAADFKLANPAAGQGLVVQAAMGVAPLATENPVVKTQRGPRVGRVGRVGRGPVGVRRGPVVVRRGPVVVNRGGRRRGIGKGLAIGLGVAAAAAIAAGAANASSAGPSCSRLAYLCDEEGRAWACGRYEERCE